MNNINNDKEFEGKGLHERFVNEIKKWSLGRTLVVLVIIGWIINLISLQFTEATFGTLIGIGILIEIFEHSMYTFRDYKTLLQAIISSILMIISVIGIIIFILAKFLGYSFM